MCLLGEDSANICRLKAPGAETLGQACRRRTARLAPGDANISVPFISSAIARGEAAPLTHRQTLYSSLGPRALANNEPDVGRVVAVGGWWFQ